MKKYLLQAILLLTSIAAFAQDTKTGDEKAYDAGYWIGKNIIWIVVGIVVLIVIIRLLRKKK